MVTMIGLPQSGPKSQTLGPFTAACNACSFQRVLITAVLFIACWIVTNRSPLLFSNTNHISHLKNLSQPLLYRLSQLFSSDPLADSRFKLLPEGLWANYSMPGYQIFAHSAFYDDRPSLKSNPVIRIIVISTKYEDYLKKTNSTTAPLYCAVHYKTVIVYLSAEKPPRNIGHGWGLFGESFREHVYTCPTDSNLTDVPVAVRIVSHPGDENVTTCVPVEVPEKPAKRQNIAVCVQSAYGSRLKPYSLIEWIEFQKLLGVDHIGLYNLTGTARYNPIFEHYQKTGLLHLRNSSYISPNNTGERVSEYILHWTPAINDCLYRNMHRFHYIGVMDFDEIIVPRNYSNLPDLLRFLNASTAAQNKTPASYVFYNQYYFLDLPPDSNLSTNLTFSRFRHRLPKSGPGYSVKSIIDPRYCTNAHNHYCWGFTPGAPRERTLDVDSRLATNQHYKKCHFSSAECAKMLKEGITIDKEVLRFTSELRKRTIDKVFKIFGKKIK